MIFSQFSLVIHLFIPLPQKESWPHLLQYAIHKSTSHRCYITSIADIECWTSNESAVQQYVGDIKPVLTIAYSSREQNQQPDITAEETEVNLLRKTKFRRMSIKERVFIFALDVFFAATYVHPQIPWNMFYRGADKSLARPDWKNNWKVPIFCPKRRSMLPHRPGWTDSLLNFFEWLAKVRVWSL